MILLQAKICLALELLSKKESQGSDMGKALKILEECRDYIALEIMGSVQQEVMSEYMIALTKAAVKEEGFVPMKGYVKGKLTYALSLLNSPRLRGLSKTQFDIIKRAKFSMMDGIEYLKKVEVSNLKTTYSKGGIVGMNIRSLKPK